MPEDVETRKDRERALNRDRQQRFRDRKRNGHAGLVTDDNGLPHARLTRLAHNLATGMNDSAALVEAGFSRNSRDMLDKAKTGLAEILKVKGLTVETVIDSAQERVKATSPMFTTGGCIDRPDWSARASGCRDAIALLDRAGELPVAQAQQSGPSLTVVEVHYSVTHNTRTQYDNHVILGASKDE